jgi:glycosyltransferase involved in cell wall biosynthesis
MKLSVVTPAFNEAATLVLLYERLAPAMSALGIDWEWIVVDDHSRDDTFGVLQQLAVRDGRVRGLRLARNSGSHVAITCGLHHADGDAAVVMAADLQDPPETLAAMLARWRDGVQIVWAVRRTRPGERAHAGFAAIYWWMMRRVVGMDEIPRTGADFFLADRAVLDAFRQFPERNVSVFALITSLGFRQDYIEYDKQPRVAGQSGWTLRRKIALVIDSLTAFSSLPIRLCALGGVVLLIGGAGVGVAGLALLPSLGGGILFIVGLVVGLGGLQLLALGILGEYVWRTLEESRRRPQYLVEAVAGRAGSRQPAVK